MQAASLIAHPSGNMLRSPKSTRVLLPVLGSCVIGVVGCATAGAMVGCVIATTGDVATGEGAEDPTVTFTELLLLALFSITWGGDICWIISGVGVG